MSSARESREDKFTGLFVLLVALHSYAVGIGLLFLAPLTLPFGGFELPASLFFVRQGGVFHLTVATGYLWEWRRHRALFLMLTTKAMATVFLGLAWLLTPQPPWLIGASALQDGAMGAVAAWLVLRARDALP